MMSLLSLANMARSDGGVAATVIRDMNLPLEGDDDSAIDNKPSETKISSGC